MILIITILLPATLIHQLPPAKRPGACLFTGGVPIDYKKAYFHLFSAMADTIDLIDAGAPEQAKSLLIATHQQAEKQFMEHPDGIAITFRYKKKDKEEKDR